jgi:hypothetical protein
VTASTRLFYFEGVSGEEENKGREEVAELG